MKYFSMDDILKNSCDISVWLSSYQVAEAIFAQKEGTGHATEQWRHLLSTFNTAQLEVVMGNLDSTGLERQQRRKQR